MSAPTQSQSFAGIIRERLGSLENAMEFGWQHHKLLQDLNKEMGFAASLGTFRTSLWRARRWWRNQIPKHQLAPIPQVSTMVHASAKPQASTLPKMDNSNVPLESPSSPQKRLESLNLDEFFQAKNIFERTP
jgi:hypothetical protein